MNILSLKDLLSEATPYVEPKTFWKTEDDSFKVLSEGVQIVCSTSATDSVRASLRIALEVASKPLMRSTWGTNPFTGEPHELLHGPLFKESTPVVYLNTLVTNAAVMNELARMLPKMDEWVWVSREKGAECPYGDLNIHVIDAPAGTLANNEHLVTLRQHIEKHSVRMLVINSFEFACRTARQKDDLVYELKELRDTYGVSIVVFSHENERNLKVGACSKGPVGKLAMVSNAIAPLKSLGVELGADLKLKLQPTDPGAPNSELSPGVCVDAGPLLEINGPTEFAITTAKDVHEYLSKLPDSRTDISEAERVCVREDGALTDQRFDIHRNGGRAEQRK